MGHYGDTIGRKRLLVLSMTMGVSTFLVGCIPTYDAIGLWAPALLVGPRLLQGFAVAREQSGAAYATQDAYGLGMSKTTFLWIPIAGNVVAVFGRVLHRERGRLDRAGAVRHPARAAG
jgi:MFS family permease